MSDSQRVSLSFLIDACRQLSEVYAKKYYPSGVFDKEEMMNHMKYVKRASARVQEEFGLTSPSPQE